MRNARFWVYANGGPVKLTLRPGRSLSWSTTCRTDEGYSAEGCQWNYPGDEPVVIRQWWTDGRDCDGRLSQEGSDVCHLSNLYLGNDPYLTDGDLADPMVAAAYRDVVWPDWQQYRPGSQYDQFAEMAGY